LIGVRRAVLAICVSVARVAVADHAVIGQAPPHAPTDWSIDMHFGVGGVIMGGALADRFDPIRSATFGYIVQRGSWLVDASFVDLAGNPARRDGNLDAIGWSGRVRRTIDTSLLGASYVALAATKLYFVRTGADRMPEYVGHAWGPKLGVGTTAILGAAHMRMGVTVDASYQWLISDLDGRPRGGYGGIELTMLFGYGRLR
jgi:hypothetical protein